MQYKMSNKMSFKNSEVEIEQYNCGINNSIGWVGCGV